jgi:hypothetical protein
MAQGNRAKAIPLYQRALENLSTDLDLSATVLSESQQVRMADGIRSHLNNYLVSSLGGGGAAEAIYRPVFYWKGAVLFRQRRLTCEAENPKVAELIGELRRTTSRLASLMYGSSDAASPKSLPKQVAELAERKEQLEADLARQSATFRTELSLTRLAPEQVKDLLPPRTALIDFVGTPAAGVCCAVESFDPGD